MNLTFEVNQSSDWKYVSEFLFGQAIVESDEAKETTRHSTLVIYHHTTAISIAVVREPTNFHLSMTNLVPTKAMPITMRLSDGIAFEAATQLLGEGYEERITKILNTTRNFYKKID